MLVYVGIELTLMFSVGCVEHIGVRCYCWVLVYFGTEQMFTFPTVAWDVFVGDKCWVMLVSTAVKSVFSDVGWRLTLVVWASAYFDNELMLMFSIVVWSVFGLGVIVGCWC